LAPARRDALLDAARELTGAGPLACSAGATAPHPPLVLLRVLADRVEPVMQLFGAVWARWRGLAWSLPAPAPRIWRT
jgi:urease accessory protein